MKKISLLVLSVFLLVSFSYAQNASWEYKSNFKTVAGISGMVKDTLGNIWYASKTAETGIVVVKRDGTPLSFSPINSVTVGGTTVNTKTGCSGLQIDDEGNIYGIFNGNDLVKINPSTGAGLLYKQIPVSGTKKEISNFGIDTAGNIYFTHVEQPAPIQAYDKSFTKIKDIVPVATNAPTCKAITVTNYADWPDGTNGAGIQVYAGLTGGGSGIFHYRAYSFDSTFVVVDTMLKGISNVESFNWETKTSKYCWISNVTDKKVYKIVLGADYTAKPVTKDEAGSSDNINSPSGVVAFGDSLYIADFGAGKIHIYYSKPFSKFNNWQFSKVIFNFSAHGVAVDPDGKIWICGYYNWDGGHLTSTGAKRRSILVLNPDCTPRDTIWSITVSGITDSISSYGRGISTDHEGNILYSNYGILYKINYKTLQGMAKVIPKGASVSLTKAASDNQGNVAVAFVSTAAGDGIVTYTSDLIPLGAVVAQSAVVNSYSRDLTLTPDGKDLYLGCTAGDGVAKYHSDNGIYGPYAFQKYIGTYPATGETVHIDANGYLWIGSKDHKRFDCWDLSTNKIIDGINSITTSTDKNLGYFATPRGIAFSPNGNKAYTVDFDGYTVEWTKGANDVKEVGVVPESFQLSQNYPNPFNPTTTFKYSLPKASKVKMVVYDIFGREVTTLINNEMREAGSYSITWNGRNSYNMPVATGTYFYKMQVAGFEKVMKMLLVK